MDLIQSEAENGRVEGCEVLLVANVGNSTIRLGSFAESEEPIEVQSAPVGRLDELSPPDGPIEALVIGSVNPVVANRVHLWAQDTFFCPTFEFRIDLPNPMPMLCEQAERVGSDRIANAIALHRRTGEGGVAVDFGTAISFAVVSRAGEFLGGAIAPGLGMSARALHAETALLPLVDPQKAPRGAACNTEQAIAAGLLWGIGGLVDRLVDVLADGRPGVPVIATGGEAPRLLPYCNRIDTYAPQLTLEGLREAYLRRA